MMRNNAFSGASEISPLYFSRCFHLHGVTHARNRCFHWPSASLRTFCDMLPHVQWGDASSRCYRVTSVTVQSGLYINFTYLNNFIKSRDQKIDKLILGINNHHKIDRRLILGIPCEHPFMLCCVTYIMTLWPWPLTSDLKADLRVWHDIDNFVIYGAFCC